MRLTGTLFGNSSYLCSQRRWIEKNHTNLDIAVLVEEQLDLCVEVLSRIQEFP